MIFFTSPRTHTEYRDITGQDTTSLKLNSFHTSILCLAANHFSQDDFSVWRLHQGCGQKFGMNLETRWSIMAMWYFSSCLGCVLWSSKNLWSRKGSLYPFWCSSVTLSSLIWTIDCRLRDTKHFTLGQWVWRWCLGNDSWCPSQEKTQEMNASYNSAWPWFVDKWIFHL